MSFGFFDYKIIDIEFFHDFLKFLSINGLAFVDIEGLLKFRELISEHLKVRRSELVRVGYRDLILVVKFKCLEVNILFCHQVDELRHV